MAKGIHAVQLRTWCGRKTGCQCVGQVVDGGVEIVVHADQVQQGQREARHAWALQWQAGKGRP